MSHRWHLWGGGACIIFGIGEPGRGGASLLLGDLCEQLLLVSARDVGVESLHVSLTTCRILESLLAVVALVRRFAGAVVNVSTDVKDTPRKFTYCVFRCVSKLLF